MIDFKFVLHYFRTEESIISGKKMIPDNLKKKCFWEYDINVPLEKIPGTIKAQRFADFWPYFHEAFKQKELNLADIKYIVQVISEFGPPKYCENVRAYVINNLIERWCK
jgi:hypothetical protein